jgi:hypothetical protein
MTHPSTDPSNFTSILTLIKTVRERIIKTVNTKIIDLYWQIGGELEREK